MTADVRRWTFRDVETGEVWTMPINPNTMSSPEQTRDLRTARGTRRLQNRVRTIARPPAITEWSFGGVIYTKEHYDTLAAWARRSGVIEITDHTGRSWQVMMRSFQPKDRAPRGPNRMWRFTYSMNVVILRKVAQ